MLDLLQVQENHSIISKIRTILQKWLIISIISLIVVMLINWFLMKFNISLEDQSRMIDTIWWRSRQQVLLQVVILWPLVEELLFRSWINLKRYWIFVWFVAVWFMFLKKELYLYSWWIVLIWVVISFVSYQMRYRVTKDRIKYSYIISSIMFWLVHITNFKWFHWREMLVVAPQLLLGFFLGNIRLKYWLQYSIFLHIFHNSMVGIGIIVAKYLWLRPLDESAFTKPWVMILILICLWYYSVTIWWIIISLFYHNDIIKSNNHEKNNQLIK